MLPLVALISVQQFVQRTVSNNNLACEIFEIILRLNLDRSLTMQCDLKIRE